MLSRGSDGSDIEGRFWCDPGGVIREILWRISVINPATHPFSLGMMTQIHSLVINVCDSCNNYLKRSSTGHSINYSAVPFWHSQFSHKNTSHQLRIHVHTHTQVHVITQAWHSYMKLLEWRYNGVPCNMILHTSLHWLRQNINQQSHSLYPQNISHRTPPRSLTARRGPRPGDRAATFPAQHTTIGICIRSSCCSFLATQTMVGSKIKDKIWQKIQDKKHFYWRRNLLMTVLNGHWSLCDNWEGTCQVPFSQDGGRVSR